MKKRILITLSTLVTAIAFSLVMIFPVQQASSANTVEHYIMALYECPCGGYVDRCDDYPYAQCEVSKQEFCGGCNS